MPTTPPTINPSPTVPQRGVKNTFNNYVDAFVTWMAAVVTQFAAVAANVYANALEAFSSATTASTAATTATDAAAAAVATANASLWVSGATVQQNANVISPLDRQTYRRKTASGSGTTDPSLDTTNYTRISVGAAALDLIATATVGSAVANIDFLNLFSDIYTKYVIEVAGASPSASDALCMQLAVGGVALSSNNTYSDGGQNPTFNQSKAVLTGNSTAPVVLSAEVRGARQTVQLKQIIASGVMGTTFASINNGGVASSSIMSGFRLFWLSGATFTAGTVRVYGVRA